MQRHRRALGRPDRAHGLASLDRRHRMVPPGPELPERDELLVAAVAFADEAALAELYDRHAGPMLGVALRVLGTRSDAEDLVHDVFVEAWQKAAAFDAQRGSVRSWLLMR